MIINARRTNWRIKGKIIGQRVLDVEGPTMETSVSASGSIKGTQVNVNITYIARPTSTGVLHGEGKGVIMAGASEMATEIGDRNGDLHFFGSKMAWSAVL